MKTSQSFYGNTDGSTTFYNWTSSASQLTCSDMVSYDIHTYDGTYGRKLFYEARGYTVTDCYNQKTDNTTSGGFSFAQYKAEIDAGRPVMLNLAGHTIVGVGYDDSTNTVYIHDTWDYDTHTMPWGGSYSGMQLLSVSVVNLTIVPTQDTGSLTVTISPQGAVDAGGVWRRVDTTTWFNSGSTETSIPVGSYIVEFKDVSGWTTPSSVGVTINNGVMATASGTYVQKLGSLTVTISPQGAVDAGGVWRRAGTTPWFDSGSTETSIPVGSYTVEFKSITGWTKPPSVGVTISYDVTETASGAYEQKTIPVIQVTSISLNFGYAAVGSTKDLSLTVKNTGGGTLTGNATTTVPFSVVSGGSYSLGPDQSQVVTVRYQPTSPGPHTGMVIFTGGDSATVLVSGKTEKPLGFPWLHLLLGN